MRCFECVHLAEDKEIYHYAWCLLDNEDVLDKRKKCRIDIEENKKIWKEQPNE